MKFPIQSTPLSSVEGSGEPRDPDDSFLVTGPPPAELPLRSPATIAASVDHPCWPSSADVQPPREVHLLRDVYPPRRSAGEVHPPSQDRLPSELQPSREIPPASEVQPRSGEFYRSQPNRSSEVGARPNSIGRYELMRELGRGGMGVVYLARDTRLGRRVAVKLLQTNDPEFTRRFIIEARATAQCSHENIVVIHEVGEHEGNPFMVLEYLRGETLASLLERSIRLPTTRTAEIMAAVLRALAFAHANQIVHRDLKPENIFLTDSGTVKVLDFGIAKVLHDEGPGADPAAAAAAAGSPGVRKTGIVGTLAYMSPEQAVFGGQVDHRTDIWTVGVMLFEMLTGQNPIVPMLEQQQNWFARNTPMPSIGRFMPELAPELVGLVDKCLQLAPAARYPDAESVLKDLEPFLPGRFRAWAHFEKGPYAGLRAFQEEDAACFFGRNREIAAFMPRLQQCPLMAIVGPSGIGKSSFVRAGVVPALRSFGAEWDILAVRPGREPFRSLAVILAPLLIGKAGVGADPAEQTQLAIRLRMEPGLLGNALRGRGYQTGRRCLLFVDQFEELYTLCGDPDMRRAFTTCLSGAGDDATAPVRIIVSVRSDFLSRVGEDAAFMAELSQGLFFLGAPGPEDLRETLLQPAELAGYRFETTAMVDEMIRHLESTPGALPLLQFTASELWSKRDVARHLLTEEGYRALGGISGALASHADQVLEQFGPDARGVCRALFLQLVTPERTRAVRELDELREIIGHTERLEQVVTELVSSRLLVVQTGGGSGGTTVEIVHESLIEAWRTLRRWLEESHEDSMFLEQLRGAAHQWQTKRHDPGLLWGGEMAEELERFLRRHRAPLSEGVASFARAVHRHRARRATIRRGLGVSGVLLMMGLLVAASVALVVIRDAQREAERNAETARKAEAAAQRRLEEVQRKEADRLAARGEVEEANMQLAQANTDLADKNRELTGALFAAEQARYLAQEQSELAQEAQIHAQTNEQQARLAEAKAKEAADELERTLEREKARSERLAKQIGSSIQRNLR
ncbi:MAG: protein kinase [Polyangiaceae bacterium]|nr:protein kinase [Polyangiaceae bacterium]